MKCKHPKAFIKDQDENTVSAYCPDCDLLWYGAKYFWYSVHGKLHKPPKWVLNLINQ